MANKPVARLAKAMKVSMRALTSADERPATAAPKVRIVPPKLFPGVLPPSLAYDEKNDPAKLGPYLAADSQELAPFYSFANQFDFGIGFPGYAYLSELTQISEYRSPTETMANEMTRCWIKFTNKSKEDKAEKIKDIEDAFTEFKIQQHIRMLVEHDNFYGRGQLYVSIKDQTGDRERQLPLVVDPEGIPKGSVLGFKPIEPIWTTPYTYNSIDPTAPDFFKPRAWFILGKRTHSSRLKTIVSRPVADLLKPSYNFGGMSLSQLIQPYVKRWIRTVTSVNDLIHNFSIISLATDMSAVLAGDNGGELFKRAQLFTQLRDNKGLSLLDKATEELNQIAVPLSGLGELQAQAQEHMAAPTHQPLVKMFGVTPTGLNATGEGEIQVFYDWVKSCQEAQLTDPLTWILHIVQLHLFGEIDEDIGFEFAPLKQMTIKELSEVRKADTERAATLIDKGVIDNEEERQRLQDDPDSGYSNLVGEAPDPPDMAMMESGQEHEAGMAALNGPEPKPAEK